MCGILGTINLPFDNRTLDMIAHRGPDDGGIERFGIGNNTVFFGHRRLSINDLSSAGHQPMFSANGTSCIIFNGEIYNHHDLRKQLPSTVFKGNSDTETVVNHLTHHGMDALLELNGIFALAILNKSTETLYLARDPFGIKPLYWWHDGNKLAFCSELKPLTSLIERAKIDKEALASTLRLRYTASPKTLFKNVYKLEPGHYIKISLSGLLQVSEPIYYGKTLPAIQNISFKDSLEQYEHYFNKAVERQLLSDVEIGILLSGGIDSALVAAEAAKHSKNPIKAFTVGFSGNHGENEINAAAETARLLGMDHHTVSIDFPDFLDVFRKCVNIVEEPSATTSVIPMYYLTQLASEHVKVVLTGQGADEPLGGYFRYQGELIRDMIPGPFKKILPMFLSFSKKESLRRGAASIPVNETFNRFLESYSLFNGSQVQRMCGIPDHFSKDAIMYTSALLNCNSRHIDLEKMMAIDTRMNLSDDLLLYTDKISMHYSLEARVPMLDIELVRFLESLPLEYKVRLRNTKIIHKKYAEKALPNAIVHRKKQGFQSPTKTWFKTHSKDIKRLLLDKNTEFARHLDVKEVSSIINMHLNGYNMEKQIQLLLALRFWFEDFC